MNKTLTIALAIVAAAAFVLYLLNQRRSPLPVAALPQPLSMKSQPIVAYQNKEEWNIKRDDKGRIESITIDRKVTENG